jgi:acyl-CoA dehydrogenase
MLPCPRLAKAEITIDQRQEWGSPGLSNTDYAPLCELMGRSPEFPPEAMNCNTPDTGNMEIPELLGTAEQKAR